MKTKIYLLTTLLFIAIAANCQFNPMNINYQDTANMHYPGNISIVDASHIWLGVSGIDQAGYQVPYSYAVKTTDGGNTWELDSIPFPGQPIISGLCAVDANTCFYVFTDNWAGGSIWKTSDGGASWINKTTTQFSDPGGYADFYHAFNANEGVAVGDPTLGYFEIQHTTDGGDTWNRVEESSIPPSLPGEMGAANAYSAIGDNIWFPTAKPDENGTYSSRCFKSVDRGQHWTVSPNIADNLGWVAIEFSTSQKGVLYDPFNSGPEQQFYRTSDGGNTWVLDSLSINNMVYVGMSSVPGFDGGYVVATNDTTYYSTTVLFTPDFFSTIIILDSNLQANPLGIKFKDAMTGWLEGDGSDTNAILKYSGMLTSIRNAAKSPEKLAIMPNPTSTEALVKLPAFNKQGNLMLRIYDAAGTLRESKLVSSSTDWTKLNASVYQSGVYILKLVSGNRVIAREKWVVQH
jgi:photosystem II stability/assembly factor-like uncharacterized protein